MEKLPPTSYVRLVDIWLICGQLIPFIEVILITVKELYNDDDEINHHGHIRKVSSIFQVSFILKTYGWFGGYLFEMRKYDCSSLF